QLKNLRALILSDTKLTSLPKEISQLKKLEELRLDGSSIEKLPDFLDKLPNLKEVWISRTQANLNPNTIYVSFDYPIFVTDGYPH
ncbi:MAG: Unknown protein, partial [uncultured Aureispira sp.]